MATIPTISARGARVPAFQIAEPAEPTVPLVFCSPHSGSDYPDDFLDATRLGGDSIRRSEDLFVDRLFSCVVRAGAPLLSARFPRAFLDVNREPYELDAGMFSGDMPDFVNAGSVRVAGGLGTIPRIVAENEEIYREKMAVSDGLERIDRYYRPFHAALEELVARTRRQFGIAILVDCHSMPSGIRAVAGIRRADIVIGDRFGASAAARIVDTAAHRLCEQGFGVARNKPYAGGFITERYGKPATGFHAIQIEINRSLYADEVRFRPNDGFADTQRRIEAFVTRFAGDVAEDYRRPLAAE